MIDVQPHMVTADRAEQLARNGFIVFERFLDDDVVDPLKAALQTMQSNGDSTRVRRDAVFAQRNLMRHAFVRELIELDAIQAIVDELAPKSIAVRAILFDKTGGANWTVPWHQDRSIAVRERVDLAGFGPWSTKAGTMHVQPPVEILRQMLTLRFHLDACGDDNGPLRVVPGTHETILHGDDVAAAAKRAQVTCTTDVGGLVVMRPLIVHASSPARHATHRRVIHVEFGPHELPSPLEWAIA